MKILVISDVHANLTALEAVLQSAGEVDATWCLGDVVGYGPDPNECVEQVRSLPNLTCVMGNHDAAVSGRCTIGDFHEDARLAVRKTQQLMSPENMQYLQVLPEKVECETFILAHGSPRDPIWEYILDKYTARFNFSCFQTDCAIVGHTHFPMIFALDANQNKVHTFITMESVPVNIVGRTILNPGSVGQPRDNDPRASYALLDPQAMTWELRRVPYDIRAVQERIRKSGLPERGAERLAGGW